MMDVSLKLLGIAYSLVLGGSNNIHKSSKIKEMGRKTHQEK
jgi:hypothetical protein